MKKMTKHLIWSTIFSLIMLTGLYYLGSQYYPDYYKTIESQAVHVFFGLYLIYRNYSFYLEINNR